MGEYLNKAAKLLSHLPVRCHEQMSHIPLKRRTLENSQIWPRENSAPKEAISNSPFILQYGSDGGQFRSSHLCQILVLLCAHIFT